MPSLPERKSWLTTAAVIFCWLIILTGVVTRIVIFVQNRNLLIDEANVARNLYERGFAGLLKPLIYEQYAPPVFLWLVKICVLLFGYGEQALRLVPLLAGIGAMVAFYYLLRRLFPVAFCWYLLGILALNYECLVYSTMLKQYMLDVLVTILLLHLALVKDIYREDRRSFIIGWTVAGSLAVLSSMPSVFVLAGIGAYYGVQLLERHRRDRWPMLLIPASVWLAVFACYYMLVLRAQINSTYLQDYHRTYFLYRKFWIGENMEHNLFRIRDLFQDYTGYHPWNYTINRLLLIVGTVSILLRKHWRVTGLLFIAPIVLTLLAASMKSFSLIPRVSLFLMPLTLLWLGVGLHEIFRVPSKPIKILVGVLCLYSLYQVQSTRTMTVPIFNEEITIALDHGVQKGYKGPEVFVHEGATPAFLYYTTIHPKQKVWAQLKGGHFMHWDTDYHLLSDSMGQRTYVIYTGGNPDEFHQHNDVLREKHELRDSVSTHKGMAYEFTRK